MALTLKTLLAAGAAGTALLGAPLPAMAAQRHHGGGGGGVTGPYGNDISWPQCGSTFPTGQAFAVVGINDGLANNLNPCLGPDPSTSRSELYWAATTSSGGTAQPKASVYVNTADPGSTYNGNPIADWPKSGTNTYGTCNGTNSNPCAWEYGYNKASQDVTWLENAASNTGVSTSPSSYNWWLDVETSNTWESNTQMNVAVLQGMVAALPNAGVYSTQSQWAAIAGGDQTDFSSLADWVAGASSQSSAVSNCQLTGFTGGKVTIAQWVSGSLDYDLAC